MQTIDFVSSILTSISCLILSFSVITVWRRLRDIQKEMNSQKLVLREILDCSLSAHIQRNFDEVAKMKKVLQELVAKEQYEEAQHLKTFIEQVEESAEKSLRSFKEIFGDSVEILVNQS